MADACSNPRTAQVIESDRMYARIECNVSSYIRYTVYLHLITVPTVYGCVWRSRVLSSAKKCSASDI